MKYAKPYNEPVFYFEELSESAQMRVVSDNVECFLVEDMNAALNYYLGTEFANSEPEMQYDFSYCQGSGLNLYGKFDLNDLVYFACGYYLDETATVTIPANRHYNYCKWDCSDEYKSAIYDAIGEALDFYYYDISKEQEEEYDAIVNAICERMRDFCDELYLQGEGIIDEYNTKEFNENTLFDEFGAYSCNVWDTDAYVDIQEEENAA
jgi:hypothetical protein